MGRIYFVKEEPKTVIDTSRFTIDNVPTNKVYDGKSHEHDYEPHITDNDTGESLVISENKNFGLKITVSCTQDSAMVSAREYTDAGEYTYFITFTQIDPKFTFLDAKGKEVPYPYTETFTRTFSITSRPANLIIGDKRKYQGQPDPAYTSTLIGLIGDETPTYAGSLSREPGEAPGTYVIDQGTLSIHPNPDTNFYTSNYNITVDDGILTIEAAPVTPTPPTPSNS